MPIPKPIDHYNLRTYLPKYVTDTPEKRKKRKARKEFKTLETYKERNRNLTETDTKMIKKREKRIFGSRCGISLLERCGKNRIRDIGVREKQGSRTHRTRTKIRRRLRRMRWKF